MNTLNEKFHSLINNPVLLTFISSVALSLIAIFWKRNRW